MRYLFGILLFPFMVNSANAAIFSLSSTAFSDREKIDLIYTCDGKNISPELSWEHAPSKTKTFALIVSDPDAPNGTFYHWVLFNIPNHVKELAENITSLPEGTKVGKNSAGEQEYMGPCPPKGSNHRYIFSLYALDTSLDLPEDADAETMLAAMQNHVVGETELKATFGR